MAPDGAAFGTAAVVGYGQRGRRLTIEAIGRLYDRVIVVDSDPIRLALAEVDSRVTGLFELAQTHVDWRDRFECDAVFIALPHRSADSLFESLCVRARGAVVVREKPLGTNTEAGQRLIDSFGTVRVINEAWHHPVMDRCYRRLAGMEPTQAYAVDHSIATGEYLDTWRADPLEAGAGVILDLGWHHLFRAIGAFGVVTQVHVDGATCLPSGVVDSVDFSVRHELGARGSYSLKRRQPVNSWLVSFDSPSGRLIATREYLDFCGAGQSGTEASLFRPVDDDSGLVPAVRSSVLSAGAELKCSMETGIHVLEACEWIDAEARLSGDES